MKIFQSVGALAALIALLALEIGGYVLADKIAEGSPSSTVRTILIVMISLTIIGLLIIWGARSTK